MANDKPIGFSWTHFLAADLPTAWATLSDTARFNRLAGLDLQFSFAAQGAGRVHATGALQHLGMHVTWQEVPVRFEAPRHLLIERLCDRGPLSRMQIEMNLTEHDAGTQLVFEARFWPQSKLLWPALRVDLGLAVKPKLERALHTMLASLAAGDALPDTPPPPLPRQAARILAERLATLADGELARHLGTLLRSAPIGAVQRLKPLLLARQWRMEEQRVVAGLLRAAQAGILQVQWEVLCPSCRMPTAQPATFSLHAGKSHCPACDLRYDASLADSVALTLRPAPEIRPETEPFGCLSSPARVPHIVGQVTVQSRQEVEWTLDLLPGTYRMRGWPQVTPLTLTVRADAPRRDLTVQATHATLSPPTLRAGSGRVLLRLRSKLDEPLTLVLERPWLEPNTLTIGRVLQWPDSVALLPSGALEPGLGVAAFTGPTLALQIARGGAAAAQLAGEWLRQAGARALQVSTGWVLATFDTWPAAGAALQRLPGTLWLTGAVGHGASLELTSGQERMAAGALLQELVALAMDAEPGQVRALQPQTWPPEALQAGFGLAGVDVTVPVRNPLKLPQPPPLQPGDTLDGRFVLGEVLGQGGFGLVLAARDPLRGEDVVVKLLRPELLDDPLNVQRFFDEGRLAARLSGQHLVRVYEWGLAEDGRLFLAMERLTGRELADVLKQSGTLDPPRAIRLAEQALAGLQEAHTLGLVHRDIKPQNLFVVGEGTAAEGIKIIDFGIALDLTGQVQAAQEPGMLVGTPVYMSPEQVLGQPLDGRSDIYALAIVLYQCLSGTLPFGGDTVMARLMARLTQPPVPLLRACRQPLPDGLDAVIARALAQDPVQRQANPAEMSAGLADVRHRAGDAQRWLASWRAHQRAAEVAEMDTVAAAEVATVAARR